MPRGPRLDAPGTLHHVMVRGIEGRALFRDDVDRAAFVDRLAVLAAISGLAVYAWALLPNHAHVLLRTGTLPLSRVMRRLLTGYAGTFNRRHRRRGHVFQNRYKSIVVEEEPYFLELVRYIHLNALRANVVPDLNALNRYPWTGHSALLGRQARAWQAAAPVLARFAPRAGAARSRYLRFVREGIVQGRRPELEGGGLRRSAGGWQAVAALRRGREAFVADERILGGSDFVATVLKTVEGRERVAAQRPELGALSARVCEHLGLRPGSVQGGGRRRAVARAREGIAFLWVEVYGQSGAPLAKWFGIQPSSVHKAARRGQETRKEFEGLAANRQDN